MDHWSNIIMDEELFSPDTKVNIESFLNFEIPTIQEDNFIEFDLFNQTEHPMFFLKEKAPSKLLIEEEDNAKRETDYTSSDKEDCKFPLFNCQLSQKNT